MEENNPLLIDEGSLLMVGGFEFKLIKKHSNECWHIRRTDNNDDVFYFYPLDYVVQQHNNHIFAFGTYSHKA